MQKCGVESETELAFAQAPPERFLVALAVLSLLSDPGVLGLPELEVTGLRA